MPVCSDGGASSRASNDTLNCRKRRHAGATPVDVRTTWHEEDLHSRQRDQNIKEEGEQEQFLAHGAAASTSCSLSTSRESVPEQPEPELEDFNLTPPTPRVMKGKAGGVALIISDSYSGQ